MYPEIKTKRKKYPKTKKWVTKKIKEKVTFQTNAQCLHNKKTVNLPELVQMEVSIFSWTKVKKSFSNS